MQQDRGKRKPRTQRFTSARANSSQNADPRRPETSAASNVQSNLASLHHSPVFERCSTSAACCCYYISVPAQKQLSMSGRLTRERLLFEPRSGEARRLKNTGARI